LFKFLNHQNGKIYFWQNISIKDIISFQPNTIHRDWILNDMEVIQLLSKADRHLGRLDMYSEYVNIDLFIRMHIAKPLNLQKIEGTQTNMEEAFLSKEEIA
jgi:hypothetical protein